MSQLRLRDQIHSSSTFLFSLSFQDTNRSHPHWKDRCAHFNKQMSTSTRILLHWKLSGYILFQGADTNHPISHSKCIKVNGKSSEETMDVMCCCRSQEEYRCYHSTQAYFKIHVITLLIVIYELNTHSNTIGYYISQAVFYDRLYADIVVQFGRFVIHFVTVTGLSGPMSISSALCKKYIHTFYPKPYSSHSPFYSEYPLPNNQENEIRQLPVEMKIYHEEENPVVLAKNILDQS